MKKLLIASTFVGLTGYLLYTIYHKIGQALVDYGTLLSDQDGYTINSDYKDSEGRTRYVFEEGVGSSDFFDMGEGGVTGMRPEDF